VRCASYVLFPRVTIPLNKRVLSLCDRLLAFFTPKVSHLFTSSQETMPAREPDGNQNFHVGVFGGLATCKKRGPFLMTGGTPSPLFFTGVVL